MKVIQISNYYSDFKGSFINQLEILADKIKEKGGEMIYIFPENAKGKEWIKELKTKYKVYFITYVDRKKEKQIIKELNKIFNIEEPDIIHSHFDGYDIAIAKSNPKNIIKIYHRHNEFDINNLSWYKKVYSIIHTKINMNYLKNKGYSIFISNDNRNRFLNYKYVLKDKSIVITNGISTRRLNSIEKIEKRYNRPIIFSLVGNWNRKGGDILFEAMQKINSNGIKAYLATIISKEFLEKQYGYVPKWIICLPTTENIGRYYGMADIFISASRKETFSYALAEAIYCELPCISSDIEGVQWAKEIPAVSFFENENTEELIFNIKTLLSNKYDKNICKISKKIIMNKYSEYIWAENIVKFYENLINNNIKIYS